MPSEPLAQVLVMAAVTWFDVGALVWLALSPYLSRPRRIWWMAVVMLVPGIGALCWYTYAIGTQIRVHAMLRALTADLGPDAKAG